MQLRCVLCNTVGCPGCPEVECNLLGPLVARRGDNLQKVQERAIKLDLGQAGIDVLSIRLQHAHPRNAFHRQQHHQQEQEQQLTEVENTREGNSFTKQDVAVASGGATDAVAPPQQQQLHQTASSIVVGEACSTNDWS